MTALCGVAQAGSWLTKSAGVRAGMGLSSPEGVPREMKPTMWSVAASPRVCLSVGRPQWAVEEFLVLLVGQARVVCPGAVGHVLTQAGAVVATDVNESPGAKPGVVWCSHRGPVQVGHLCLTGTRVGQPWV